MLSSLGFFYIFYNFISSHHFFIDPILSPPIWYISTYDILWYHMEWLVTMNELLYKTTWDYDAECIQVFKRRLFTRRLTYQTFKVIGMCGWCNHFEMQNFKYSITPFFKTRLLVNVIDIRYILSLT